MRRSADLDQHAVARALSITGRGGAGGDIAPAESLARVGKTLGAALGIPAAAVDQCVIDPSSLDTLGKTIRAGLRG